MKFLAVVPLVALVLASNAFAISISTKISEARDSAYYVCQETFFYGRIIGDEDKKRDVSCRAGVDLGRSIAKNRDLSHYENPIMMRGFSDGVNRVTREMLAAGQTACRVWSGNEPYGDEKDCLEGLRFFVERLSLRFNR